MSRRRRNTAAPTPPARIDKPRPQDVVVAKPAPVSAPARAGMLNVIRRDYRVDGSVKG